jgi:hypothetical protein
MKPAVILVGADKGGVGKTTVSRALLDYLADHNIVARAFDTETPRGTLHRFHPDITEIVDVTHTSDQMRILDTLEDSAVKVSLIDVRAGQLHTTLVALRDIGFLDAAKEGEFTFLLFHILGSSLASLDEIAETAPFASDAHYYLVKNYVNDSTFFEWDPKTYKDHFEKVKSATDITVPKLDELAYEQVDLAGVPFSSFRDNKTADGDPASYSFVLRGYVRTWLRNVSEELDDAGVIQTLGVKGRSKAKSKK